MTKALSDYDAVLPLQKALAACNVQASPWALVEACAGDMTLTSFATCARHLGLEADVVLLRAGDLTYLTPGTLVAFKGGGLATVVGHDAEGVLLEEPSGARQRITRRSDIRPAIALEVRPSPPEGTLFLERLRIRLRTEPHVVRAVLLAGILSLVFLALALAAPILTRAALASALPDRAQNQLAVLAGATVFLGLQVAYIGWLRRRAQLYMTSKLSEKASVDLVAHLLQLPFSKLQAIDVGTVQQATRSAAMAAEALPLLSEQLLDALLGIGFLGYIFTIDVSAAMVAGAAGTLIVLAGFLSGGQRLERRRDLLARTRFEQQGLYETFAGIETVKSESIEGRMLIRWLGRLLAEEESALALRFKESGFTTVLASVDRVVFASVLLFAAHRSLTTGAPVADLVAVVQASAGFMVSVRKLAQLPPALARFRSDVERVNELLKCPAEKREGARQPSDRVGPAIVLRDVWFRYSPEAPWVVRGLDLVVQAGESVMLTWPSGAGKSTLLRLLSGLLAPSRGDALVFGIEAAQARRMITYIPQQATLYPTTLMENLKVLSGSARPARILAAAESTGLLDLVATWPMGLETIVSLGASNLSSGQQQLVLFTAAAASETPILLLDEALAHVDLGTRSRLRRADLFRGRTVVAVAHDASPQEAREARVIAMGAAVGLPSRLPS